MSYCDDILRRYPGLQQDSVQTQLMITLLKIHKVTREELERNLYLYQQDLETYSTMLSDVRTRLDSIQQTITTE